MQCGENHNAAVDPLLQIHLFYVNMLDMTHLKDLQECRGEEIVVCIKSVTCRV